MNVATWNVNGIRARLTELQDLIDRQRPDVICLQEIKAPSDQIPSALFEMLGYWSYWHGVKGYSGVGLQVRKDTFPEPPAFGHPDFDYENRIVAARLGAVTVASVYVPNGGKDFPAKLRFLEALERYAASAHETGSTLLVCGDLNVARTDIDVHPKERKATAIGQLPEERQLFERILSRGLVDVMRILNPADDQLFTWWAPWRNLRQRNIGWRIDYVLASEGLAASARTCVSQREFGTSDHAPLVATFDSW